MGSSAAPAPVPHTHGPQGVSLGSRTRDRVQNLAWTKYEQLDSGQVTESFRSSMSLFKRERKAMSDSKTRKGLWRGTEVILDSSLSLTATSLQDMQPFLPSASLHPTLHPALL